jgi:hypothetical protein
MIEPSVDVTINKVVGSVPVFKRSRKEWDLRIIIYSSVGDDTLRIMVQDQHGILDVQDPITFECSGGKKEVIEEAKILAASWTQFSRGSKDPDHTLPGLAAAGHRLFRKLFDNPDAEPLVTELVQRIRDRRKSRVGNTAVPFKPLLSIQILTQSLYLPWELLYPSFEYNEFEDDGFFGYAFSIEQQPFGSAMKHVSSKTRWGVTQPTEVSLQLDRRLKPDAHTPISSFLAAFHAHEIRSTERSTIADLKRDLSTEVVDEIAYFCCHGYVTPAVHVKLTCGNTLRPEDLQYFAKKHCFVSRPIVFLNTCNGAVMDAAFRTSFIDAFTGLGAVAVIAPQAEVRTTFALTFASDFFDLLFGGMADTASLGDIGYEVRAAARAHGDNSGLLYSVYSQVPVFFQRKLNRRIQSDSVITRPPGQSSIKG